MKNSNSFIYLDNNATTFPLPKVVKRTTQIMTSKCGNPSSPHSSGVSARKILANSRRDVSSLVGASEEQVIFTSGGTESNGLVLKSVLSHSKSPRFITSAVEHSSVLGMAKGLESFGSELVILNVDKSGRIDPDDLKSALTKPTSLVSIQWANSETGTLQPIEEIGNICQEKGVLLHVDAAQAVGRVPISFNNINVDLLTFSAHKLHGPRGIGAICMRNINFVSPQYHGGDQEMGIRPGTENLPGIAGFGVASIERLRTLRSVVDNINEMRDHFEMKLFETLSELRVNGHSKYRTCNTSNIYFPGIDGTGLMAGLDRAGLMCSQTSACTSSRPEPSYVLLAMGLTEDEAYACVRFSYSALNTLEEAERAAEIVISVYHDLKSSPMSVSWSR